MRRASPSRWPTSCGNSMMPAKRAARTRSARAPASRATSEAAMAVTDASEKKPSGNHSARRRAREFALQGLYQWLVGGADAAAVEGELQEREMSRGSANESASKSAQETTHPTATERTAALARRADMAHFRQVLHGAIDHAAELRADFAPF